MSAFERKEQLYLKEPQRVHQNTPTKGYIKKIALL